MPKYSPYYKPRSVRHTEKKVKRKIIYSIIFAVILVYVLFFWVMPYLISGLFTFKKPSSSINPTSQVALAPPVLNIPFEATNSSSLNITGYSMPNAKVNIYLDNTLQTSTQTDAQGQFSTNPITLTIGSNNITGKTVSSDGQESLPSKNIVVNFDNSKPSLQVDQPTDGMQIHGGDKKITVSGKTDLGNTVTVNGRTLILNGDGSFSISVGINDGDNTISIVATNEVGNTNQVDRNVNYSSS